MVFNHLQQNKIREKDTEIQELKNKQELLKANKDRKKEIIENIINENNNVLFLFSQWHSKFGTKLSMISSNEEVPEELEEIINALTGETITISRNKYSRRATVTFLGNKIVDEKFLEFEDAIYSSIGLFSPNAPYVNHQQFLNSINLVGQKHHDLIRSLSQEYLN